jgi:hypothetical protein
MPSALTVLTVILNLLSIVTIALMYRVEHGRLEFVRIVENMIPLIFFLLVGIAFFLTLLVIKRDGWSYMSVINLVYVALAVGIVRIIHMGR